MERRHKPAVGDVYGVYVEELKKYGAYQILEVARGSICYIVLDYLESEPPKEEILPDLQPFYSERFRFHHALNMNYISNDKIPGDYIYCGMCPPVTNKSCNNYAGDKWRYGIEYLYEMEWRQGDTKQKENYKKYINSGEWVTLSKGSFRKNERVLTTTLYEAVEHNFSVELFPCVTDVEIEGPNPGILDCIAGASLIQSFRWKSPQTEVLDFRNLQQLHTFELDGTGVKRIYLPDNVRHLKLTGKLHPQLQIIGKTIGLNLSMEDAGLCNYGLCDIHDLSVFKIKELDLREIPRLFPELHSLMLYGKPGIINNLEALEQLPFLRDLTISDLFGFSAEDMKILERISELRSLDLYSIPKEAGMAVKKAWKGKLDYLEVKRLRSDDWLQENLENPLRNWDGSEFVPAAAYKKTMQQYKKTKKLLEQAGTREEAVAAAKEYGLCFNRLNQKYHQFIETDEREDLFLVLEQLYEQFLKDKNLIDLDAFLNILDEIRDEW
ncbi:MAG: hypothetical protein Q4D32_05725 [Eubacteriales bacterium]|nr:hypothetical protein [Eubacteriales bacterium]